MPPNPDLVVVHPLVLLSVVDHYNRVAKDTRKRVVGVLLGEFSKGTTDVTNSFAGGFLARIKLLQLQRWLGAVCRRLPQHGLWALHRAAVQVGQLCATLADTAVSALVAVAVPFEEDERDPSIWFLDHSYLENMAAMYKKVNGA